MCALKKKSMHFNSSTLPLLQSSLLNTLTGFVQILLNKNTFSFQVRSWLKSHMERCDGPYQEELVINAAVKVQGEINWIHTSQGKKTNVIQGVEEHYDDGIVISALVAYAGRSWRIEFNKKII